MRMASILQILSPGLWSTIGGVYYSKNQGLGTGRVFLFFSDIISWLEPGSTENPIGGTNMCKGGALLVPSSDMLASICEQSEG